MNKLLKNLCFAFTLVCFTSCTTDNDDNSNNSYIIGVWDYIEIVEDETRTLRLVFEKDYTGLKINNVENITDEITSSVVSMVWIEKNDTVEVSVDTKEIYELNSKGQLVSSSNQEIILDKISDKYPM